VTVFDLSSFLALFRIGGSTRLDLLQRMSTGDLRGIAPGEGRMTVLTTPLGRIVDWLLLLAETDCLWAVCSAGARDKVTRWLRKHIFFNDDAQVAYPESPTPIYAAFGAPPVDGLADLPPLGHRLVASQAALRVVRAPAAFGESGWLVFGAWQCPTAPLPSPEWEIWRIRHGLPAYPHELSEDYIPLETGLWGAVSFDKGCYVGQEIIARMESRGQLAKKLCALRAEGAVRAGSKLLTESGEEVGLVTSVAGEDALGYVRATRANSGEALRVAGADDGARCVVVRPVRI